MIMPENERHAIIAKRTSKTTKNDVRGFLSTTTPALLRRFLTLSFNTFGLPNFLKRLMIGTDLLKSGKRLIRFAIE